MMFLLQNSHRVRTGGWFLAAMLVGMVAPLTALAQTNSEAVATRSSIDQGATVKVTPKLIGSADKRWEFAIVLDSHSADLSDDLMQSASVTTDDGRTIKSASWTARQSQGRRVQPDTANGWNSRPIASASQ